MKNLTKYLARSGTIHCRNRKKKNTLLLWWWAFVVCFWIAILGFIASEKLETACQSWLGGL